MFEKYTHSRNKYRIYLPLKSVVNNKIVIPTKVNDSVRSSGYEIDDYMAGIAIDSNNPKKKVKIGKLLDSETKKIYDNDPQRSSVKNQKIWVVISRHPYDIAGMSFDRGWTSCMDLDDGENRIFVDQDIKLGTIVAYLIKDLDKNINNPIARISIKPYSCDVDKAKIGLFMGRMYGQGPVSFYKTVQDFCESYNKDLPKGVYTMLDGLYSDGLRHNGIGEGPNTLYHKVSQPYADEDLLWRAIKSDNVQTQKAALENDGASLEMLKFAYKSDDFTVRTQAVRNLNADDSLLLEALQDSEVSVRKSAAKNKSASVKVLNFAMSDKDENVRLGAVANMNADDSVLLKGIMDSDEDVRKCAVEKPNAGESVLLAALNSKFLSIRISAIQHNNAQEPVLLEALKSTNVGLRRGAANAINATEVVLLKALEDEDDLVRSTAAFNANANDKVLEKALKDLEYTVRTKAAQNYNASEHILLLSLDDDNEIVRNMAAGNKNITEAVIDKALDDTSDKVKHTLMDSGSYAFTKENLIKAKGDYDKYVVTKAKRIAKELLNIRI